MLFLNAMLPGLVARCLVAPVMVRSRTVCTRTYTPCYHNICR